MRRLIAMLSAILLAQVCAGQKTTTLPATTGKKGEHQVCLARENSFACEVEISYDGQWGQVVDLSPLRRASRDYITTYPGSGNENKTFRLNVCGPLVTPCGKHTGSTPHSACIDDNNGGEATGIGWLESRGSIRSSYTAGTTATLSMSTNPDSQSSAYSYGYDDDTSSNDDAAPLPPNCEQYPAYNRKVKIYFKCGKGLGNPEFVQLTAECEYLFTWTTQYACPLGAPPPKSALEKGCNVVNADGQKIDLSPLARPFDNWVVEGKDRIYSIAVCGALIKTKAVPKECQGPLSFVCSAPRKVVDGDGGGGGQTEATAIGRNLGMWASPRLFNDELYMSSDGGDQPGMYDDDGDDTTCSPARVIFKCDPLAGLGEPRLAKTAINDKGLECGTVFEWATSTACPLMKVTGAEGKCTVTDTTYGYKYNMNALKAVGAITLTSDTYQDGEGNTMQAKYNLLPVCDDSKSGNTLVLGGRGDKIDLGSAGATLIQTADRNIELQMLGDDCTTINESDEDVKATAPRSTILRFICSDDLNPPNASISLIEESKCSAVFSVVTALACPPAAKETSCIVADPKTGNVYDLSRLSRRNKGESNWRVVNDDPGCGFIEINVCAPLINKSPFGKMNKLAYDDGYAYDDDLIMDDNGGGGGGSGAEGPQCPHATAICAYEEMEDGRFVHDPQVLGAISQGGADNAPTITESGDLMMRYDAPGSCSSEVVFKCLPGRIGEPFFISLDKDSCVYHFEWRTSAACPVQDQLGADCKVRDDATGFTYDLNPLRQQGDKNNLAVAFQARTSKTSNSDGGELEDWIVALNVCDALSEDRSDSGNCKSQGMGSLMVGPNNMCIGGGSASKQLELNDGVLSLTYKSDLAVCLGGVKGTMVTKINFVCNATAPADSRPTLLDPEAFTPKDTSLIDKCSLVLDWQTPYACGPTETPCVAEDPSGNQYDLSSLIRRDSNWLVKSTSLKGTVYQLNVCRSLVPIESLVGKMDCNAPNAGCILTGEKKDGGMFPTWSGRGLGKSSSPRWDVANNHLTVVLKSRADPKVCSNGESITVIEFGCNLANKGFPQLVSEDTANCKYKFVWLTSAACPMGGGGGGGGGGGSTNSTGGGGITEPDVDADAPIECTVTDPTTQAHYDLSYLKNTRRNWIADDEREAGKYDYEMNVCAPLVGGSTECEDGVGSCQINAGDEGHKSLGLPSAPLIDENGQLYLNFSGGTNCVWGGNGNNRSTRVDMQCPRDQNGDIIPGVLGHPTFIEEDENCGYHFEWSTSFACPVTPSHQKDCKVVDLIGGDEFDFTSLQKPEKGTGYSYSAQIGKKQKVQDVSFNVCGNVVCGGSDAGACIGGVAVGDSNRAPYFDNGAKYLQYEVASVSTSQASDLKDMGLNCESGSKFSTRIEFQCDPDMEDGAAPTFKLIEASGCSAIFSIATLEACEQPKNLVECITTDADTGYTYDLSSLGRTGTNWIALDGREGNKYEYEINVCRSLAHVPNNHKGCVGFASCQVSRKDGFAEKGLGVSASPQVYKDEDGGSSLELRYTGGVMCGETPRSTRIIFTCGARTGSPVYLTEAGTCQYVFTWTTSAACPLGQAGSAGGITNATTKSCRATDRSTGLVYDLGPLSGEAMQVVNADPDESRKFELGICSTTVDCGDGGGDDVVSCVDGSNVIGKAATAGPQYLSGVVTLTYLSDETCDKTDGGMEAKVETLIIFECDQLAGKGTPMFVHQADQCTYVFKWRTAYVCAPILSKVPCVVTGTKIDGTVFSYDFGPLARESGDPNWLAVDTLQYDDGQLSNHEYLINVCRSLNTVEGHPECAGHAVCQLKATEKEFAFGIGDLSWESIPTADAQGLATVTYPPEKNAPMCHNVYQRSSKIVFSCLQGSLGAPVFLEETDTCQYVFEWQTSAACTEPAVVVGIGCRVDDAVKGVQYDLTGLMGKDYVAANKDEIHSYKIAVCGSLQEDCGDEGESGACQRSTDGFVYSMGKPTGPLELVDGVLTLEYKGGTKCGDLDVGRNATIEFVCDANAGAGAPELTGEPSVCTYLYTWKTAYACTGTEEAECVAVDNDTGEIYDLRELELKENGTFWNARNNAVDQNAYTINVCHSLVTAETGLGATGCGSTSTSVCMTTPTGAAIPLGIPTSPVVEDGALSITYVPSVDAKKCANGKPMYAKINFQCSDVAGDVGQPNLIKFDENACQYLFEWSSAAACKVQSAVGKNCKVTDQVTGETFDLTTINGATKQPAFDVKGTTNSDFSYLFSDPCGDDDTTPVQQRDNNPEASGELVSLGEANTTLVLRSGSEVIQSFFGGKPCTVRDDSNGEPVVRHSEILYVCDPTATPESGAGPVGCNENARCYYQCLWPTSLVCPKRVTYGCKTKYVSAGDMGAHIPATTKSAMVSPGQECVFPFAFEGETYYSCADIDGRGGPWCATAGWSAALTAGFTGPWGYCKDDDSCPVSSVPRPPSPSPSPPSPSPSPVTPSPITPSPSPSPGGKPTPATPTTPTITSPTMPTTTIPSAAATSKAKKGGGSTAVLVIILLIVAGIIGAVVVVGGKKGWFNRRKGMQAHTTMTYQELSNNAAYDPADDSNGNNDDDDEAILGMDGDVQGQAMPPWDEGDSNA